MAKYAGDYFEVDDDAVFVNLDDDGTATSLLILDDKRSTFYINPLLDVKFQIDRV